MSRFRGGRCALSVVSVGWMLGCGSDTATAPSRDSTDPLYWRLALNHHAITMALTSPYNTLRLVATPQTVTGEVLTDTGRTTYTTSDTSVTIDSTGLLTAVAQTTGTMIIASRTVGNVTHVDTALVNVNLVPVPVPTFTTLTLTLQPGDSARRSIDTYTDTLNSTGTNIVANVLDAAGDSIPNVLARFASSDVNVLPLDQSCQAELPICQLNVKNGLHVGHSVLSAEATVYGVRKTATITYTVGWSLLMYIAVRPTRAPGSTQETGYFSHNDDTVGVGAIVYWLNRLDHQPVDVVFDTPAGVQGIDSALFDRLGSQGGLYKIAAEDTAGGNIRAFNNDTAYVGPFNGPLGDSYSYIPIGRARRFFTAGTYPYHSTLYGTTGVIHVMPPFQVP